MTIPALHPFQLDLFDRVRAARAAGKRIIVVQGATGAGKTVWASYVVKGAAEKGSKVLFMAHRRRLVDQISEKLIDFQISHGVFMRGEEKNKNALVQVASRDTLLSRCVRNEWVGLPAADLVICDEAHHCSPESEYRRILENYPQATILLLSATPVCPDGNGLGPWAQAIECAAPTSQLVKDGYLVPLRCYAPDRKLRNGKARRGIAGDLVESWKSYAEGLPTVLFVSRIQHSLDAVQAFNDACVPAIHVDANTPDDVRDKAFDDVASGKIKVVSNVGIITEGVDVPALACCVLYCEVGGRVKLLQAAGRIMRRFPGKTHGVLIDHCLDERTEILTRRGFVGRTEINDADEVAAMDLQTGLISWQPILSRIDRELLPHESVYEVEAPSLDLRVTGNHRIVCKKPQTIHNLWSRCWSLCNAESLASYGCRFRIPVSGVQEASGVPLSDDELRFIGWFLTDGNLHRQCVGIGQAEHPSRLRELESCLAGCGFDYRRVERKPTKLSRKPFFFYSIPKGTCPARPRNGWAKLAPYLDKQLSPLLEDVTERQFEVLLYAIHLGDGHKDRLPGSYRIVTGEPTFASRLQSLCVRRGFRCNIYTRPVPSVQTRSIKQTRPTFVLNIKKMREITLQGRNPIGGQSYFRESVLLAGERVWCVENNLHTLVVRRNGKVAIVGNSGAVFRHGFPDEDMEWPLEGNPDKAFDANHDAGKTAQVLYCRFCELLYHGQMACPQCGKMPSKPPKSLFAPPPVEASDELLTEVEREQILPAFSTDEKIKHWIRCIAVTFNRHGTFGMAAQIYKKKYKEWPKDEFPCMPERWQWKQPIASVYPNFGKKSDGPQVCS